jgi:hypothetical protein
VDLSAPHFNDDSPPKSVSSSTLSTMKNQLEIDGEIIIDSLEVYYSIMISPPNSPTIVQLNNVEDIPQSSPKT